MIAAAVAIVAVGASWLLMKGRLLRPPYPPAGQAYARVLGCEEEAFNFGEVVPNAIYRSGRPDARFVRRLYEERGLRRMISLNGEGGKNAECQQAARELGIELHVFTWSSSQRPPRAEREQVQRLLQSGGPVLVHCSAGVDRTGLAIATYRVQTQGWTMEQAMQEMRDYWFNPRSKPVMVEALREYFSPAAMLKETETPPAP